MQNLAILILYSSIIAHSSCLNKQAILEISEQRSAPIKSMNGVEEHTNLSELNTMLGIYDSQATKTLAQDRALIADTFADSGFSVKQYQALAEIANQSSTRNPILNYLSNSERKAVESIEAVNFQNLDPQSQRLVETALRDRAIASIENVSTPDANLRAKLIARELNRQFTGSEANQVLEKLKFDQALKNSVKKCLQDPKCIRPALKPSELTGMESRFLKVTFKHGQEILSAVPHVRDGHVLPSKLQRILEGLGAQNSTQRLAAESDANNLLKALDYATPFKRLNPEAKKMVLDSKIDPESWDFLIARKNKGVTTLFRDQRHLDDTVEYLRENCFVGGCKRVPGDKMKDGVVTLKMEQDGVRYAVIYCSPAEPQCREGSVIRTFYPECGPGIWTLDAPKLIDLLQAVGKGSAGGNVASAYRPNPCK